MINELKLTIKTSPLKTIFILIFGWIIMILLNYFLNENGFFPGTRITFPISVVYFSKFTPLGILFSFVFLFSGLYILNRYKNLNTKQLIISYIVLIILGNLAQGSIHQTFYRSFIDTDFQYYHDAISIKNGFEFISNYNQIQDSLTMHAKTHPPFIRLFVSPFLYFPILPFIFLPHYSFGNLSVFPISQTFICKISRKNFAEIKIMFTFAADKERNK